MASMTLGRITIYLVFVVVCIPGVYLLYLWSTYTNSTTTSGAAYGFVIGDTKTETYGKAQRLLPTLSSGTKAIYVETEVSEDLAAHLGVKPGFTILTQTLLHDIGFSQLRDEEQWDFYFDGSYFDKLSLTFCDEKLCKIHRHRKEFELP